MLQSERFDVKQKFDTEQPHWDEMYYRTDYQSKGFQWRKDSGVELCVRHLTLGSCIADLGCGCGHASATLARLGFSVFGADISKPMISKAATNAKVLGLNNCRFEVFDFVNDAPKKEEFDGLLALGFIEYFDDPVWVLKRMHQLLKPGGMAVVQIWNRRPFGDVVMAPVYRVIDGVAHPWRQLKRIGKAVLPEILVQRLQKAPAKTPLHVEPSHRRYTPAELHGMAAAAGFKVIDGRGSRFFPSKFFFRDGTRVGWDERLQKWTKDKPRVRVRAIDYVAALKKV
jgi:2-polyprenyl-3-methyl-5-hydroxy-6-metoxy-1,4-benzoquinol methylase